MRNGICGTTAIGHGFTPNYGHLGPKTVRTLDTSACNKSELSVHQNDKNSIQYSMLWSVDVFIMVENCIFLILLVR